MTPQERDLIQGVFDRLARAGGAVKDADAENFIRSHMQTQPDAAYGLVQAVVVLESSLAQAQARIAELQNHLDQQRGAPAAGAGFMNGASPWGGASVPRSGPAPQAGWQQVAQPAAAPPQQQGSPWAQQGGGGFLRNAATMAAGVAGGTLIAEGISSLFGGHRGGFGGGFGGGFAGPTETVENVTVNNYYDDRGNGGNDGGFQDASYDDGGQDGGFDGGFDDT